MHNAEVHLACRVPVVVNAHTGGAHGLAPDGFFLLRFHIRSRSLILSARRSLDIRVETQHPAIAKQRLLLRGRSVHVGVLVGGCCGCSAAPSAAAAYHAAREISALRSRCRRCHRLSLRLLLVGTIAAPAARARDSLEFLLEREEAVEHERQHSDDDARDARRRHLLVEHEVRDDDRYGAAKPSGHAVVDRARELDEAHVKQRKREGEHPPYGKKPGDAENAIIFDRLCYNICFTKDPGARQQHDRRWQCGV
mmetsp:Transcript_37127/g.68537  ORF Transcript_37127/g.68537 Transcript_37127/m.68537 type:complete len:252 (+) Transcript_37127:105-860(+)